LPGTSLTLATDDFLLPVPQYCILAISLSPFD